MQHVSHLLVEYRDHELTPWRRKQVEAHLRDCPACQAELERLDRLSDLLSEYALPDTSTAAETFRAQVMLRLSRREKARTRYASWVWHVVPLSLGGALLALQVLFALFGVLGLVAALAGWAGVDLSLLLERTLGQVWNPALFLPWLAGSGAVSRGVVAAALPSLWGVAFKASLYMVLITVFVPYAGWVGALWRATRHDRT